MGLRRSFWLPFFGVPRGPLGRVGARLMPTLVGPLYAMMAKELDLQPDDDLLEVGCGSSRLLAEQTSQVHHVAGLDASEIQVGMARRRLADRVEEAVRGQVDRAVARQGRVLLVQGNDAAGQALVLQRAPQHPG